MKIAIILNGISRKKKFFYDRILPALQKEHSLSVFETRFAGHAMELAREAALLNFDLMLAAGGDGTLNQVLNGLLNAEAAKTPILGLIPLGSGNDFAGTVGIQADATQILELIQMNQPRYIDIGQIQIRAQNQEPTQKYFLNVCSLGMGPTAVQTMQQLPAWLGADMRYLISILKTFLTGRPEPLEIKTNNWSWSGHARVLAVANGRSFGNRIYIAPQAKPDDGLFNVFLASNLPLIKFLLSLLRLKAGKELSDKRIYYTSTSEIHITSAISLALEAEGELVGHLPALIKILPQRILFLRP